MSRAIWVIAARLVRGFGWERRWQSQDAEHVVSARSVRLRTQCQHAIRPAILAVVRINPARAALLAHVPAWDEEFRLRDASTLNHMNGEHATGEFALTLGIRDRGMFSCAGCCTTITELFPVTEEPFALPDTFAPVEPPCIRNELSHFTVRCVAFMHMSLLSFISIKMP